MERILTKAQADELSAMGDKMLDAETQISVTLNKLEESGLADCYPEVLKNLRENLIKINQEIRILTCK